MLTTSRGLEFHADYLVDEAESVLEEPKCIGEMSVMGPNIKAQKMSPVDKVQESYEQLWKKKLNDPEWLKNDGKGRVEFCADFLKANNMISNETKILDIGCGRGTLAA